MDLVQEINREKACVNDLLKMIEMHVQDGRYELAQARTVDIFNSIQELKKLEVLRKQAVKGLEKVV